MQFVLFAVETTVDAAAKIIESGVLGAIAVLLGVANVKQWYDSKTDARAREAFAAETAKTAAEVSVRHAADMKAVQDQRVHDHQAMTATLLRTTEQSVACLTTVANGMEATREAMADLKATLRPRS